MRKLMVVLAVLAAACSPAANEQAAEAPGNDSSVAQVEAPDPERDAMVAALAPQASEDIGVPVSFSVTTKTVEGDWGWLVAQPWTPEGAQIDWSTTRHAERAANGVMDGSGTTYALLKRENGAWRVVAFTVGPTDVAYEDWPQRYGAPPSLMGLPTR